MDRLDLNPRNITNFLPELCDGEAITNRTVRSYVSYHLPQEYVEQDIWRIEGDDRQKVIFQPIPVPVLILWNASAGHHTMRTEGFGSRDIIGLTEHFG
jgi:hypothetical protein